MAKRKSASGRKSSARKSAGRKTAARKATARKTTARKTTARKAASRTGTRKAAGRKTAGRSTAKTKTTARGRKSAARKSTKVAAKRTIRPVSRKTAARTVARKAPSLNRSRRTAPDDELIPSPPSSLDLDRSASAVRTGRRGMRERYKEHTETSPALTAGDVDADWESAYSVGDEAPGGDNPTPDQDIVDDIGRAVGNEYQDNEELKGADKIVKRDKHRWELDPASSEDYDDRD
jgi:hypothetical protein